ncbi:MAG: 50S ribosomal protein L35 [Puniceicoccales bacterium]|jgi:large subunit ribosomal protein L35|nr:50S ribosomal protein L35 [Puniceicoccales bacterium]
MQKTKKSIAKRYKVTGTGKIMRRSPNTRHLLRNKSTKSKRRSGADKPVAPGFVGAIRAALPYSH